MPDWNELNKEIQAKGNTFDITRQKYLDELFEVTRRNIIIYYSGWLQKTNIEGLGINDVDKNGFMSAIHNMDKKLGLDLILHTPGGDISATESIVDYLRAVFGNNIRAIIPQLALSAGTMIALSCKEILMGKHSSLGPIDPQIGGLAAHGIIEEFNQASTEISNDNSKVYVWQPIISKYSPTLIGECNKAIKWSEDIVREWLQTGMFEDESIRISKPKIDRIIKELGSHAVTKSHNRHISIQKIKDLGIITINLEDNEKLQDAVLSVHHSCMATLAFTPAVKIIQNHTGTAFIMSVNTQ